MRRCGRHPEDAAGATRDALDPIPDRVMRDVLNVARWTGSARNRQPWKVALITASSERTERACLGAHAAALAQAPVVVLLAVDREMGADAEFDAGRFEQSLMLAAHIAGLGSCPITFFPDGNARAATIFAGLAEPWRVRTAAALGYPVRDRQPEGARSR